MMILPSEQEIVALCQEIEQSATGVRATHRYQSLDGEPWLIEIEAKSLRRYVADLAIVPSHGDAGVFVFIGCPPSVKRIARRVATSFGLAYTEKPMEVSAG